MMGSCKQLLAGAIMQTLKNILIKDCQLQAVYLGSFDADAVNMLITQLLIVTVFKHTLHELQT